MTYLPVSFMFRCRIYLQLRHDQSSELQVIDAGYCIDNSAGEHP